jgi:hypothetical protein
LLSLLTPEEATSALDTRAVARTRRHYDRAINVV